MDRLKQEIEYFLDANKDDMNAAQLAEELVNLLKEKGFLNESE